MGHQGRAGPLLPAGREGWLGPPGMSRGLSGRLLARYKCTARLCVCASCYSTQQLVGLKNGMELSAQSLGVAPHLKGRPILQRGGDWGAVGARRRGGAQRVHRGCVRQTCGRASGVCAPQGRAAAGGSGSAAGRGTQAAVRGRAGQRTVAALRALRRRARPCGATVAQATAPAGGRPRHGGPLSAVAP